jgi:multiple sugar transport system permease protein
MSAMKNEAALPNGLPTAKAINPKKEYSVWRQMKINRTSYFMMAPFMLLFIAFTVIPVIMAIALSFTYYNVVEPPQFLGLADMFDNYRRLFMDDDVFVVSLRNTLVFAVITGPVSYIAALLIAWAINELNPKVRAFVTLLFYAPSLSSNVYFIWRYIFSADSYGLLNNWMTQLGFIDEPVLWLQDQRYTLMVVIIVQLWMSLGTSFLAFIAGLQGIDKSLYEAGAIDGIRNRWQELYHITLPSMKEQLLFGAVMQISAVFSVSTVSAELVGRPSVLYSAHTLGMHMEDYALAPRYELGYASAIAVVLFGLTLGINQLVRYLLQRKGGAHD